MVIWMKVNMKFLSVYTAVLSQWPLNKKRKLFISDAHLKNATREQNKDRDPKKVKFLCNICKKFT